MPTPDLDTALYFERPYATLLRRCPHCSSVAAQANGERLYVCADVDACGVTFRPHDTRCPRCHGIATLEEGALLCRGACQPLSLPTVDPRAGWEMAAAEALDATYERMWGDPWAVAAFHDVAWDSYSGPVSRLQQRWGAPAWGRDRETGRQGWWEPQGREVMSEEGAKLARVHAANVQRIAEMSDALRAFGEAVQADTGIRLRGGTRTESPAMLPCVVAALPMVVPSRLASVGTTAIRAFWRDDTCRSWMVREVGAAIVIELHRAIVQRGGSFEDISDMLRHLGGAREQPFAHYKHAVAFWCGDHGTTVLGWGGSSLAHAGGAEPTHGLPGGMRIDEMAVSPSHASSGAARNVGVWTMVQDVTACIGAARAGGEWTPPDPDKADRAATCAGGRRLAPWELELVRLCDFGVEVASTKTKGGTGAASEWRKLAVTEAVERVRAEAVAGAGGTGDPAWGPARHLTTMAAKDALRAARRAIQDALEAWQLTPPRERAAARPLRPERDDAPPRHRPPVPARERAVNAWDREAL